MPDDAEIKFDAPIEPEMSLRSSELGGKVSLYLSGIDLAISSFYTWDDYPTTHRTVSTEDGGDVIHFHPEHHRLTFVGSEFSFPWRDFVLRGEGVFYRGRYFEPENARSEAMFKRNSLNWMIGVDWSPGNDWAITAQFADDFIFGYEEAIKDDANTMLATFRVSKKLFRQTLDISSMGQFGINDGSFFTRTSVDYALTDEIHLLGGVDLFFGNEGVIGQYDDNDEAWMKAKYSF
jgi:hypothetical protein